MVATQFYLQGRLLQTAQLAACPVKGDEISLGGQDYLVRGVVFDPAAGLWRVSLAPDAPA